jgi:hypothetical protein
MITKKQQWYVKFIWTAGVVLGATCLVLLYWLIFPAQGLTFSDDSLTTSKKVYTIGENVAVTGGGEFCNNGVETTVERRVESRVGGEILNPLYFFRPSEPYCAPSGNFVVTLPGEIPVGTWHIAIYTTYKANPVRSVTIVRETNEFVIVDSKNANRPTILAGK